VIGGALELPIVSRSTAAPLIYFRTVPHAGKAKGHVVFQGFGTIESAERVSQFDQRRNRYFANYRFDLVVFRMDAEQEGLDWSWITSRRDPSLTLRETLALAPQAWGHWIRLGARTIGNSRTPPSTKPSPSTPLRPGSTGRQDGSSDQALLR
jgi:hypothetical protein